MKRMPIAHGHARLHNTEGRRDLERSHPRGRALTTPFSDLHHAGEISRFRILHQIVVRTKAARQCDVPSLAGSREHCHGHLGEVLLCPDPAKGLETVQIRHLDIQEHRSGNCLFLLRHRLQHFDHFATIRAGHYSRPRVGFLYRAAGKEKIVRIVVSD
jgi:hypothetical protein